MKRSVTPFIQRILQLLRQRPCWDIYLCFRKEVERHTCHHTKSGENGDDNGQSHDLPFQQPDQGINAFCKAHGTGVAMISW
ncbi:MAG: hypothetical protein ACLP9L_39710 [Thermoguttaceae bacterium]